MTTVIAWIVVFGVLVAIHELGHFFVAKGFGMKVDEYSLGFGPKLWARKLGETLYAVRIIPLGGYVRIAGMEGAEATDPRAFPNRPLWQRLLVIGAGPVMNMILAVVLFAIVLGPVGLPTGSTTVVAHTLPGYPAARAGIRPGDRIVAVDGRPIRTWIELERAIRGHARERFTVAVVRSGRRFTFRLTTRYDPADHARLVGIEPRPIVTHLSPWGAIGAGFMSTVRLTGGWFVALFEMISGRGPFQLTGPVGIAVDIGQAAAAGWAYLILLAAELSANLGLFNILPFPVLDGSRLFLLGLEGVRRRAIDPARESMIHLVGMMILLLLVIFVTYHDIARLIAPRPSS